jgi:hypothetical protein
MQDHGPAEMAQEQQSSASGAFLGECKIIGVCKAGIKARAEGAAGKPGRPQRSRDPGVMACIDAGCPPTIEERI